MISVGGRGRVRRLRLLILPFALLGLAATVVLWPSLDQVPASAPAASALRVRPEITDEPGLPAPDDLTAQIQAMRGGPQAEPVFHYHDDGAVSVDLGHRFLKMSVATVDAEGQVHTTCVDVDSPWLVEGPDAADTGRER